MKQALKKSYIVSLVVLSFLFAFIGILLYKIGMSDTFFVFGNEGVSIRSFIELVKDYMTSKTLICFIILFCAFLGIGIAVKFLPKSFYNIIYKYRYLIALVVLVFCVVFEISGSSISFWGPYLQLEDTNTLFRTANPFRSDEFAVNTVFAIAQGQNPYEAYPYISEVVRGTSTDMAIVYGQPMWDIGVLFRPFQLGYLLFGSSRGLSFFWCARFLVLLLVSFDFGMLILKKNRWLSVIYSVFITFSPVVAWWFAINGLVEMLIFGQLCVLLINSYMNCDNWKKKIFLSFAFFWSGGCYLLVFYPAWQVCIGYAFLALFIWIVLENRKKFKWNFKVDAPIILITGAIIGITLLCIVLRSSDTIKAVLNTAYPGKRVSSDKISILELFTYGYNLFLPFVEPQGVVSWTFLDLCPLGIIMSLYVIFKEKTRDKLLIVMLIIQTILIVIYTCPVPIILLKLTLLTQVPAMRIIVAIGLINIILLFRSAVLLKKKNNILIIVAACVFAVALMVLTKKSLIAFDMTRFMLAAVGVFFAFAAAVLFMKKEKAFMPVMYTGICGIIAACSIMVNPIQKGMDFILENELTKKIHDIAESDKGKWIVDGIGFPMNNFTLMAGAPTINSTNVYPQLDTWKKIDTNGENEEIYNRYAHIFAEITSDDMAGFELIQADYFKLNLKADDLASLDVSYVLSMRDLEQFSNENVTFSQIDSCGQYYIYKVNK